MSLGALNKQSVFGYRKYFLALSVFLIILLAASPGFSSTIDTSPTSAVPSSYESPLVRTANDSTVYLLNGSNRYVVDNVWLYLDYLNLGLRIVSQDYINSFSSGGVLPGVVGSTVSSDVFLISSGSKLWFGTCDIAQDFGVSCDPSLKLPPEQLARFNDGPAVSLLAKSSISSSVFYVKAGKKNPIASMADLFALNVGTSITVAGSSLLSSIPTGDVVVTGGSLIKTANSAAVYAVNNWSSSPSVFPVASFNETIDLGLGYNVGVVPSSRLAQYSVGSVLNTKMKCGSNTYIGSNGLLYKIDPSLYSDFGFNSGSFQTGGEICSRFTISPTQMSRFILNNGTIFKVENGTKRGFTSYAAYQENGGGPAAVVIPVSSTIANSIPTGPAISAANQTGETAIIIDLLARVNAERSARGLSLLSWNQGLSNSARNWSVQMASTNSFAHSNLYPLLGTFQTAAENIGLAGSGARSGALHNAWMNSTGHRVNLLGLNLDVIGIGAYCAPDGRLWVTQQFGRWPNSALPSTFGPTPSVSPIVMNDGSGPTC